jgi:hypothetical protein
MSRLPRRGGRRRVGQASSACGRSASRLVGPGRDPLPPHHWKILNALLCCRGLADIFTAAGTAVGNTLCPTVAATGTATCQGAQAFDWLQRQAASLLPVHYHLVFTLPHLLNHSSGEPAGALQAAL